MGDGLTNSYIEKSGLKLLKDFLGCFPADFQPQTPKNNFSIIFNLSDHNQVGTHFIAIDCRDDNITYFDSFGKPCTNKLINTFIRKNIKGRNFVYNKTKVQHESSGMCGIFCLGFLISQESGVPLKTFLKSFHKTNLLLNDKLILDCIKKLKHC